MTGFESFHAFQSCLDGLRLVIQGVNDLESLELRLDGERDGFTPPPVSTYKDCTSPHTDAEVGDFGGECSSTGYNYHAGSFLGA